MFLTKTKYVALTTTVNINSETLVSNVAGSILEGFPCGVRMFDLYLLVFQYRNSLGLFKHKRILENGNFHCL